MNIEIPEESNNTQQAAETKPSNPNFNKSFKTAHFTEEGNNRKKTTQKQSSQTLQNTIQSPKSLQQVQLQSGRKKTESSQDSEKMKKSSSMKNKSKGKSEESYDRKSTHENISNSKRTNSIRGQGKRLQEEYESIKNGNYFNDYMSNGHNMQMSMNYQQMPMPMQNMPNMDYQMFNMNNMNNMNNYINPINQMNPINTMPQYPIYQTPLSPIQHHNNIPNSNPNPNTPSPEQTELLQIKISLLNYETENVALKEKIKELNSLLKEKQEKQSDNKLKESKDIKELKNKLELKNKEINDLKLKNENIMKERDKMSKIIDDFRRKDNEFSDNVENYNKEVDSLHKEIKRKDDLIKNINDDYDNLQKYVETLKSENANIKNKMSRMEDTNRLNIEKISELENEKMFMEKKFHNEELKAKNYKLDINNLHDNFNSLKMNYEMLLEKQEILKNENSKLKLETDDTGYIKRKSPQINQLNLSIQKAGRSASKLREKQLINNFSTGDDFDNEEMDEGRDKDMNYSVMQTTPNKYNFKNILTRGPVEKTSPNNYNYTQHYQPKAVAIDLDSGTSTKKSNHRQNSISSSREFSASARKMDLRESREFFYPSENIYKLYQKEIEGIESKIANLTSEKTQVENELFKLPDKQKSASQINKKRILEGKLAHLEKEISVFKIKLKDIFSKK